MPIVLLVVVTVIESAFLWLAIGAYQMWLPPNIVGSGLPLFTRVTVMPALPFPWQGSPWIAVIWVSAAWGCWQTRQAHRAGEALPTHLAVLLGVVLVVAIGMMAPEIGIVGQLR